MNCIFFKCIFEHKDSLCTHMVILLEMQSIMCKFFHVLLRYLQYTMNPEKIRKQDAASTIGYINSNIIGQPLAWDFFRENYFYFFKV